MVPLESPTAHALSGFSALTPNRTLFPTLGLGLATLDHFLPFQCMVKVSVVMPGSGHAKATHSLPTAQASVAESALTPYSVVDAPLTVGLCTRDHFLPFQCRTIVVDISVDASGVSDPAAQTSVAETAVTPKRRLDTVLGSGLATLDHFLPFQCMISVLKTLPVPSQFATLQA